MPLMMLTADVPYEVLAPAGAFVVTAFMGMGGLIAWMIKQEYARTAGRSREDALIMENSQLKIEIARSTKKVSELEELVLEIQHERDYERRKADDAIRHQDAG